MLDTDFDGLPGLQGAITSVTIIDHDGNPNNVIDDDNPFEVRLKWTVSPSATAKVLDGTWTVKAYAESIGPGPEKKIGETTKPADGSSTYTAEIKVPVGRLKSDVEPDSGVYKVALVLTYRNRLGRLTEIAAFAEGNAILLREP